MTGWIKQNVTRRSFLAASAISAVALAACSDDDDDADSAATRAPEGSATSEATAAATAAATSGAPTTLPATPACGDDDEPTIEQTEGPYFTPNSPERTSLVEDGMAGTRLVVSGSVLSTQCAPVERALVDFWQCDNDGVYDNEGYRLRGHQFTDADGRYQIDTIVPGLYPGRTRHIHVKVQAPGGDALTTQLYFPDEAQNASDGIFNAALLMDVQDAGNGQTGAFDFVLELA